MLAGGALARYPELIADERVLAEPTLATAVAGCRHLTDTGAAHRLVDAFAAAPTEPGWAMVALVSNPWVAPEVARRARDVCAAIARGAHPGGALDLGKVDEAAGYRLGPVS